MSSRSAIKASPAARACSPRCSAAARTSTSIAATPCRCTAGEAVAANRVTHMIDPWSRGQRQPRHRLQRREGGDRIRALSHRPMIPPVNATTSSAAYTQAQQQAQSTSNSQASSAPAAATATARPSSANGRRRGVHHANDQVNERGEQDRRGGAHRGSGVRADGPLDVRRQRADRAARDLRHRRGVGKNSTPRASPSSSSISTPAARRRCRRSRG